jgi:heme-degrading monooxygenase HmoA
MQNHGYLRFGRMRAENTSAGLGQEFDLVNSLVTWVEPRRLYAAQGFSFGRAQVYWLVRSSVISRVWHGWTTQANANAYESLLKSEIFIDIRNRQIAGYHGIHLLRRSLGDAVEFVTVMWFDSMEAVRAFAGEDYEVAVVPPKARALLSHFDERSQHYEVKAEMKI